MVHTKPNRILEMRIVDLVNGFTGSKIAKIQYCIKPILNSSAPRPLRALKCWDLMTYSIICYVAVFYKYTSPKARDVFRGKLCGKVM